MDTHEANDTLNGHAGRPSRSWRRGLLVFVGLYALLVGLALPLDGVSHQDEAFYLHSIRGMVTDGDWVIPRYEGQSRIRKPILFYWQVAVLPGLVGYHPALVHVGVLAAGLGLLAVAWRIGGLVFDDERVRVLAIVMLASSDVVYRYSHYVVPEMLLTLMISAACWCHLEHERLKASGRREWRWRGGFYLCMGLGFMVKGPVGVLLPLLTAAGHRLWSGRWRELGGLLWLPGLMLMVAIIVPWYAVVVARVEWDTFKSMMLRETVERVTTGTTGPLYFLPYLLVFYLPWTLLPLAWWGKRERSGPPATVPPDWRRGYLAIWLGVSLLFHSLAVREKHQWYALQWAVPLVFLLAKWVAPLLGSAALRSMCRMIGGGAVAAAAVLVAVWWLMGQVMAPPWGVALVVATLGVGGVILAAVARRAADPLAPLVTLGALAMLVHFTIFAGLLHPSPLNAGARLAGAINQRPSQPQGMLLTENRYLAKKLSAWDLPGVTRQRLLSESEDMVRVWERRQPRYVIIPESRLTQVPPDLIDRYEAIGHAYHRRRASVRDWLTFLVQRDVHLITERFLLLELR